MKHKINLENWNRKEHFEFFNQFDSPYYGVTIQVDCTRAYQRAKELGVSFYAYYMHKTLVAVNAIPNFRYRTEGNEVYEYERIDVSSTVFRDDKTFGFSHIDYSPDLHEFAQRLQAETDRVKSLTGLLTAPNAPHAVHFSALPWVDFTSISESTNSKAPDSCPKFAIGKLVDADGKKQMSYAVHVHHALVDGYHLGLYIEKFKELMGA